MDYVILICISKRIHMSFHLKPSPEDHSAHLISSSNVTIAEESQTSQSSCTPCCVSIASHAPSYISPALPHLSSSSTPPASSSNSASSFPPLMWPVWYFLPGAGLHLVLIETRFCRAAHSQTLALKTNIWVSLITHRKANQEFKKR